jgi:glycosyltransferase involved in cell wall biosynthesis
LSANTPLVCIDCSPLLVRSAGVKTYLYHWLSALRSRDPANVRTFLEPARLGGLDHAKGHWHHPARIALLQTLNHLPSAVCDAVLPPGEFFHISTLMRKLPRRRLSATLYDLTPWILPESHTDAVVAAEKAAAAGVLQRSAGIIAISENTKSDAVRILGLNPEKIRVIYPGVSKSYFEVAPAAIDQVRERLSFALPYFLFVGTIEPRKNVDRLLTAWQALPRAIRAGHQLVIAGMPGWHSSNTMRRLLQVAKEDLNVRYLNYVPERDMPALIAAAHALVYPSLYEGFGLPVAQAMAAGCPVITSNVSALPEITAGAAMLIEPRDETALTKAIASLAESPEQRACLREQGIRNAARYTWENSAAESLKFFREIAP